MGFSFVSVQNQSLKMKLLVLLVALAAAVYAEPEADAAADAYYGYYGYGLGYRGYYGLGYRGYYGYPYRHVVNSCNECDQTPNVEGGLPMAADRRSFGIEEDSCSNHGNGYDPEGHGCEIMLIQECLRWVIHCESRHRGSHDATLDWCLMSRTH